MFTEAMSIAQLPMIRITRDNIRDAVYEFFDCNPQAITAVHDAIGKSDEKDVPEQYVTEIREVLAKVVHATDIGEVDTGDYRTCVRAGLLSAWRQAAGDPDDQLERWLTQGAPAGIRMTPARPQHIPVGLGRT